MKNIVVLGGSYAGVSSVHYLLKHVVPQLPDSSSYQVVLVTPSTEVVCRPATVRGLISDNLLRQDQLWTNIKNTLETLYSKDAFRFVHGKATALDTEARAVAVQLVGDSNNSERIEYHSLIIATGASTPSPLFSLNEDGAALKKTWAEFRKALPDAKHIVLTGGGATAVETAAELGEHLNGRPGWFGSKVAPIVKITLITSAPKILPGLRDSIAETAESYLTQLGVTVVKNIKVTGVSPEGSGATVLTTKTEVALSDGRTLDADIYIPAAGLTPNTSFVSQNLLAEDGRIKVDPSTARVEGAGPRVYAFGDASNLHRPFIYFLKLATPILGHNIKRDLLIAAGKDAESLAADKEWKTDPREAQLVTLGRNKAVGVVMGTKLPGWLVWWFKGRDAGVSMAGGLWGGKDF